MKKFTLITNSIIALLFSIQLSAQTKTKDWTAFSQKIDITTAKKIKFKLTAKVKVISDDENGKAGLWVRVDNKNKKTGFFENMNNRPITSSTWDTYTIEGTLDKKSMQIYFGGLVYGNGDFVFDDFKLSIENAKTKEFEPMFIDNSDFEKETIRNKIPGWPMSISEGNDEAVKGFSTTIFTDQLTKNNSLMITGEGIKKDQRNYIGPLEGYSPQVGTLITMLNNLKERIEYTVGDLSKAELDFIVDENANSIGALLAHLTATEKLFQIITFEEREPSAQEMDILNDAMELGDLGRKNLNGKDVQDYLAEFTAARIMTMKLLKEKDDEWLATIPEDSNTSNFFSWFHVMEHQSSHLGQILFLKKRIPPEKEIKLVPQIKD